jgi:hypothetical protein
MAGGGLPGPHISDTSDVAAWIRTLILAAGYRPGRRRMTEGRGTNPPPRRVHGVRPGGRVSSRWAPTALLPVVAGSLSPPRMPDADLRLARQIALPAMSSVVLPLLEMWDDSPP